MLRLMTLLVLLSGLLGVPAHSQEQQRIVALVNDEVISLRDVTQRMRIIMATSRLPNNPEVVRAVREQAMRSLIDERLEMQEAKRRGISVSQQDLDTAINSVERQLGIPAGRLEEYAKRADIDANSLIDQIRAEMTWARMIRSRLLATVTVTDQEIDERIEKLKSMAGQTEDLVSEILIPVDNPDQEEPQRQTALHVLQQLRGGASFPALARQFSRGTTAANGGDVGWVPRGTLPEEVEAVVARMNKGDISEPIRTVGGYQIILLRDRRQMATPGAEETKVTLKQILLPLPQNATQNDIQTALASARAARAKIQSCNDVEAVADQLKAPGSGSLGTLRLGDLPAAFRDAVSKLAVNQTSEPVQMPKAIHLFTLCDKEVHGAFDRNQIRQNLLLRHAELLAQRYIRELRRDATIEYR